MDALLSALRAAGEPTRLRILGLLGHGELTVSELVQILRQSQPRVSRHLRLLCDAGLLDRFREGAWVFYRLVEQGNTAHLLRTLVDLIPADDPEIARDLDRLSDVRDARASAAAAYFRRHARDWNRIRSLYVAETEVEAALLHVADERPIGNLLDVGTGTGRMLEIFAPHIERGLGIDLSPEMLTVARAGLADKQLDRRQVRLGDMYDLPVDNLSQDLVVFHQVLHFADDPALAIREAARVLSPGGTCLVADFAPHDMDFLRDDHAHRRLGFAEDEIVGWGRAAGLTAAPPTHLEGGDLTVTLWRLDRPLPHQLEAAE